MPAAGRATEPLPDELPLDERIRRLAYQRYLERGGQSGSDMDDWLQAEAEVREEVQAEKDS